MSLQYLLKVPSLFSFMRLQLVTRPHESPPRNPDLLTAESLSLSRRGGGQRILCLNTE